MVKVSGPDAASSASQNGLLARGAYPLAGGEGKGGPAFPLDTGVTGLTLAV